LRRKHEHKNIRKRRLYFRVQVQRGELTLKYNLRLRMFLCLLRKCVPGFSYQTRSKYETIILKELICH
jgi:hypothetical protein